MNKDWILRKKKRTSCGNVAKRQAHSILSSYMMLLRESTAHGATLLGAVKEGRAEPARPRMVERQGKGREWLRLSCFCFGNLSHILIPHSYAPLHKFWKLWGGEEGYGVICPSREIPGLQCLLCHRHRTPRGAQVTVDEELRVPDSAGWFHTVHLLRPSLLHLGFRKALESGH